VDSWAQKFMGSWISTIFFLSYYFFKFTSFFFSSSCIYYLIAWKIQIQFFDPFGTGCEFVVRGCGSDRDRVYDISNTTTEDL
jgi:hypothetical protein